MPVSQSSALIGGFILSAFFSARKKRILPVLLASLALPLIVCLEAPFEIYGSNMEEFLFSLSDFLPFCLLIWFLSALVVACALYLLPQPVYRFVYPVAVATAFLFFLQGTYLNLGISSLPGDNMGEDKISAFAIVINTVVWIVIEGLAVASAFLKKRDPVKLVCLLLTVIVIGTQIVAGVFVGVSKNQMFVPKYERMKMKSTEYAPRVMSRENLTTLSREGNVFVFIVDRFDETYAELAYEKTPEVYDELSGFTWFQDHVSLYSHTFPAVTWMLTDVKFDCAQDRVTYQNAAFEGDIPLKTLHDAGYTVNVYTQSYYSYSNEYYLPEYIANVVPSEKPVPLKTGDRIALAGNMIQMAFYRCLPLVMKGMIGDISSSANARILMEAQSDNTYTLDMKDVYDAVTAEDFTLADGKTYSYIHVTGCHDVTYNEQWEPASDEEKRDVSTSVRTSFQIIDRYLKEMKRLGVYDDATIIITGDHCAAHNDTRPIWQPRLTALFVKPSGSGEGPCKVSTAQVAHDQIWATIFKSEGITIEKDYGETVFEVPEGENRTRYHIWQTYMRGSLDEYVYEVTGPGKDFANWKEPTPTHYDKFLMD